MKITQELKASTILSINNYYYRRGGAEFVFFEQNRLMEEIGWNVVPFAMQHPNNFKSPWSNYFVDEIEFGEQYSMLGKLARIPKVIYSFEARQKLTRLIDATNPNICHAHNIYHHISPSILGVLKQQAIPTVLTLHDLKLACPSYKMLTHDGICERCNHGSLFNVVVHKCVKGSRSLSLITYLETMLHRVLHSYIDNVDRFVVPSLFFLEKFAEWGFNRDQFVYIPNFIELREYQPDFNAGKSFLYFGRLSNDKGLSTLLKAAKKAGVSVVFVGTGHEQKVLEQLTCELNIDATFLGYLSGEKLHDVIRSARAAVLPSELYENAPISVMEAYALGKPVIGAAIGGIKELIKENVTGLSFESGSIDDLARALQKMANETDSNISKMGRAGRAWVEAEFTPTIFRDRLLDLYQSLGVSGL